MAQSSDTALRVMDPGGPGGPTPPAERRGDEQRLITILRVGKLIAGDSQELCLIRNISEGGLMAHVYSEHRVGDRVVVELKSDTRVTGTIRWVRDDNIGVEFDERIDVSELLRHQPTLDGRRPRAPRLDIRGYARMKIGSDHWRVEVRDLSQGGAKVRIDDPLPIGEDAIITVDGLRPVKAIVRWQEFGHAGLEFLPRIAFDELIQWLGLRADGEAAEK